MRRVLILAYYFPPVAASGSMRPAGFCAHLPNLGYEPIVLSAHYQYLHPPIAVDDSLSELLNPKLDIRLVDYVNWQKRLLALREKLRGIVRGSSSNVKVVSQRKNDDQRDDRFSLKAELVNRLFRFPDQQKEWSKAAVKYARGLSEDERPDVVFATANPWSALQAGVEIASYFGVPFVADFRDPWVCNPKPPLTPSLGHKAEHIEREIVKNAARVIVNTPELANSFLNRYPGSEAKILSITNGYHQSLADKLSQLPEYRRRGNRVELCYFGSVYELRKPTILLRSVKELLDAQLLSPNDLLLRFTGGWIVTDSECNALAEELESKGVMQREEGVNHDLYLARLKTSDILLILQQAFPLQIPAKIYEYMASGRPIIVIGGEGATANLVERARLGKVCGNSLDEIKQMLSAICSSDTHLVAPDQSLLQQFSYKKLTEDLAACFSEVLAE